MGRRVADRTPPPELHFHLLNNKELEYLSESLYSIFPILRRQPRYASS
jgi:hypothetical protein